MVASFRHLTSRALDPFPHHHNVVANTVTLADGSHRGLDTRHLYHHAHAASALATAEMRHRLSLELGVRWRPSRKPGGWEIDGIDDRVLREFSKRRNEIDDALHELEEEIGRGAHPTEIEHIVLRTRPAKTHTPAADLVDEWRERAAQHGLDGRALRDLSGHTLAGAEPSAEVVFRSLAAPDGICAGGSVFSRADALVALANHPVPQDDGPPQPLLGRRSPAERPGVAVPRLRSRRVPRRNRGVAVHDRRDARRPTAHRGAVQPRPAPRGSSRAGGTRHRRVHRSSAPDRRTASSGPLVVHLGPPLPGRGGTSRGGQDDDRRRLRRRLGGSRAPGRRRRRQGRGGAHARRRRASSARPSPGTSPTTTPSSSRSTPAPSWSSTRRPPCRTATSTP